MTQAVSKIGLHGKIPTQGDFITLDLPRSFSDQWDHWLQQSILASQEALGENWLQWYLVSPIWRFSFPRGVLGENGWAGIILPSVDSVGRYFPLTFAAQTPSSMGAFEFMCNADAWYSQIEDCAIAALDQKLKLDEIQSQVQPLAFAVAGGQASVTSVNFQRNMQYKFSLDGEGVQPSSVLPLLCDSVIPSLMDSVTLWWTKGAQHVPSVVLMADGLPRANSFTAMLNGQWGQWHWPSLL